MASGKRSNRDDTNPYAPTIEVESLGKRPDHTQQVIKGRDDNCSHSVESINPPPHRPPETLTGRIRQEIERIRGEEDSGVGSTGEESPGESDITQDIAERPHAGEPIPLTRTVEVEPDEPADDPTHEETPQSKYTMPRNVRVDIGMATDDPDLVSNIEGMCRKYKINLSHMEDVIAYEGRSNNSPLSIRFAAYADKGNYVYSFTAHDKRTGLRLGLSKEDPSSSKLDVSIMFNSEFLAKKDLHKAIRQGMPMSSSKDDANIKYAIMRVLTSIPAAKEVGENRYKRSSNTIVADKAGYVPNAFSCIIDSVNSFYSEKEPTQY